MFVAPTFPSDLSGGAPYQRPQSHNPSHAMAARKVEEEIVVHPSEIAAVSYLDRVRATLELAGIGNADMKKHSPAARAAAVYAIRSGEAFHASPYADSVLHHLPVN